MLIEAHRLRHEQHLDGATWSERRAAEAVKERDAAAAAVVHRRGGIASPVWCPRPCKPQIQRMGGMSSAVIGGFCEHSPVVVVHELVTKCADMAAKETAKEHGARSTGGWQAAAQTGPKRPRHIPEARSQNHRTPQTANASGQRLATGAWHDFHENNTARRAHALRVCVCVCVCVYVDPGPGPPGPSTEYARALCALPHLTPASPTCWLRQTTGAGRLRARGGGERWRAESGEWGVGSSGTDS
jgi:hypothetical protein